MSLINHNELFDFEGQSKAMAEAKQGVIEFGKATDQVIDRIKKDQAEIINQIRLYKDALGKIKSTQVGASASVGNIGKEVDAAGAKLNELKLISSGLANIVNVNNATIHEMEAQLKGYQAQLGKLKPAQSDYHHQLSEIGSKMKELLPMINVHKDALKNSTQSINAAEGSYRHMQKELGMLRTRLRDMPDAFNRTSGAINKNNREAVELNSKIQRLDSTLKNADKSMGLYFRNVGNYDGALKKAGLGIKNLVASFGMLVGIGSAFDAFRFITDTNKQFDSLNSAIRLVSGTSVEFAKNQAFIRKTAEDLGLEIIGLTGSFKNFYTAATTSGVSADQTREMFLAVSKAAAGLKLSQDDVNGVFTAFGQALSKGTLQSEELRGQIGERIPGAFSLMAKALKVTQVELGEMLKAGKVLSADALPKLTAELEKAFGQTGRIEGMQAAMNRFSNTMKRTAESEAFTNMFTDIVQGATDFVNWMNQSESAAKELENGLRREQVELNGLVTALMATNDNQQVRNILLNQIRVKYPEFLEFLNSEAASNDQIARALKAVNQLYAVKIKLAGQSAFVDAAQTKQLKNSAEFAEAIANVSVQNAIKRAGRMEEFNAATVKRQGEIAQEVLKQLKPDNSLISAVGTLFSDKGKEVRGLRDLIEAANTFSADQVELERKISVSEAQRTATLKKQADNLNTINWNIQQINKSLEQSIKADGSGTKSKRTLDLEAQLILLKAQQKATTELLGGGTASAESSGAGGVVKTAKELAKEEKLRLKSIKDQAKAFKDSIRDRESLEKELYELALKQNELRLVKELQTEDEFNENKYILTAEYVNKAIALEERLGKNADQKKIQDYKNLLEAQGVELEKFQRKELDTMRSKGRIDSSDMIDLPGKAAKRDGTLLENPNKAKYYDTFYQDQIDSENNLYELKKARRELTFKDEIDHLNRVAQINEEAANKIGFTDLKLKEQYSREASKKRLEIERLTAEQEKEIRQRTNDAIFQLSEMAFDSAFQIVDNARSANREKRLAQIEEEKEREMAAAGSNADARLAIEKRFNEQLTKEKIRQAKQDKNMALFQIAINTAMAIAKAYSTSLTPYDAAINAAIAGGVGLAQAIVVASRPLPQFMKGTRNAPKGLAEVSEAGYEIVEKANGKMFVVPTRSIIHLQGGEKIYTHKESERIIERAFNQNQLKDIVNAGLVHERMATSMREGSRNEKIYIMSKSIQSGGGISKDDLFDAVIEAFKHQPNYNTIITERGFDNEVKKFNERTKILNNRYST